MLMVVAISSVAVAGPILSALMITVVVAIIIVMVPETLDMDDVVALSAGLVWHMKRVSFWYQARG